jgi:hypothetical protein
MVRKFIFFSVFLILSSRIQAKEEIKKSTISFYCNTNFTFGKGVTLFWKENKKPIAKDEQYFQDLFAGGWSFKYGINFKNRLGFEIGILEDNFRYKYLNQSYSYYIGSTGTKITDYYYENFKENYYGFSVGAIYAPFPRKISPFVGLTASYYCAINSVSTRRAYEEKGIYLNSNERNFGFGINLFQGSFSGFLGIIYNFSPKYEFTLSCKYSNSVSKRGLNGAKLDEKKQIYYYENAALGMNIGINFKIGRGK